MQTTEETIKSLFARLTGDDKHLAAATSTLDVLWVLYDRVLNVSPENIDDPDRDRFYLSKGHGPMAYYTMLAAKGFIEPEALDTWRTWGSPLGMHPDRNLAPGVEISAGSLGHGLPLGVGTALALRAQGRDARVVVLMGDGEFDEGSNHETMAIAGRLGLDRLTAVVIDNKTSSLGWPGGIATRFATENWDSTTVNGRDHDALYEALTREPAGRPQVVVAEVLPVTEGSAA
ncbi:thiamine pyrophosphate-dependent enzyme [Amycolatopsis sp. PS_44_ISF1]|uniref:thiamine pyrophosphate-dependent enzyme n=1 Tax=Amycolatopsis sp. PS_44_ISF1 TaxID=2974917 RepID=UPI0028DD7BE1|nr:thiamine pyrophosphate-dependent enzyme [Amycolatopsis sp. PS_44_ISF1]MDT8909750.1 thiamine pyrophosphate-dependent enzyme [Amycolatopsis sp. PS_44_ISF1]